MSLRSVAGVLLLSIAPALFCSPPARAAVLAPGFTDFGQTALTLIVGDPASPSEALAMIGAESSPGPTGWWRAPIADTDDARSGRLTSFILAALVIGAVLKLISSGAYRKTLAEIYFPRSY